MRPVKLLLAGTILLSAVSPAAAQSTDAPAQAPPSSPPLPAPLVENDPMLEPIAAAPHLVSSWDEALGMLRARSTDFHIALDEIERAEGQWRQALAGSLPTLNGSANITLNPLNEQLLCNGAACSTFSSNATTYGAGLSFSQPLLAPRAWYAVGTANVVKEAARLSVEDQKRVLAISLANAVVSVVTAERISEINRIGLRAALDRLTLARRRVALGAGNALDTVRADQDVAVARSSVVTGDESLRKAREALGLALGFPEAWGVPSDIDLNGLEASARATCSTAASVDERADIAAARTRAEAARRSVKDVRLQYSPTINIVSSLQGQWRTESSASSKAWSIGAVLSVPFFDGGARYGALRDTQAQESQAQQRLEAARRNATVQITQAQRSVEVSEDSRRVAERSRDLARETERLSRVAFQAGTGTSLDLIESGRRLREAESQLALQEFNVVQARIAALLALSRCRW